MAWCSKRSFSSLPIELVEEILCRVPIRSLVGCKSVCEQWCALLNDKRFNYKHLNFSQKRFIHVDRQDNVQLLSLETQAISCLRGPSDIFSMIHCDGLLLCRCISFYRDCTTRDRKLAVWNPLLSRVKWIEPPNSYKRSDVFGFGYDNVSRDNYKILRLNYEFETEGKSILNIEIYEFKSKLWRRIDATLDLPTKLCYAKSQALSMNGNMYWTVHRKKDDSKTDIIIHCFDFSRELFKDLGFVDPFEADTLMESNNDKLVLSGFGGERLSLLHQHKGVKIEVWVTNKVTDAVVSWSKYFNVTRPDLPILYPNYYEFPAYFIDHKTNKIIVRCGKLDVTQECNFTVYEMSGGEIKEQVVTGRGRRWYPSPRNHCYVYVPSLVPVPE